MKKVMVTGGTGFVGRRLIQKLLDQDLSVRILVRDPARLSSCLANRLEVVLGDLGDTPAIRRALQGVHTVFHLAALATAFDRDPQRYNRVNAQSLAILLEESLRANIRRFVHVSTVAATPAVHQPTTSGLPAGPTPYAASKILSEKIARHYASQGLNVVIVRPTRVYGPGPWNDANGATRVIAMYLRGLFRFRLKDGGVRGNYVHVDDVADGLLLAAKYGQSGKAYILGGEDASMAEYLAQISRLSRINRRVWSLPPEVMVPVAWLCLLWGKCGGSPSLTPRWLRYFLEDRPADISHAVKDLGYHPRSLGVGLKQTLNWLYGNQEEAGHDQAIFDLDIRGARQLRSPQNWR